MKRHTKGTPCAMAADHEREILELKAQALDRVMNLYLKLQYSGFYSHNWVELAELMEEEIARLAQAEKGEE